MKNSTALMARLRSRIAQDRLTDGEFTEALAEILAATIEGLNNADTLLLSHEIRELEEAWRESCKRPPN